MAFQPSLPLHSHPHNPPSISRRPRTRLCLPTPPPNEHASPSPPSPPTTPPSQNPKSPSHTRRAFLIAAAAATIATVTPTLPPPTQALTLAPTPINPYARRRRERTYHEYAQKLEQQIESVAVADFRKVVSAGGGGLKLSYRMAGFAAFLASAMSTAVVHPLDSIKTRMQAGLKGGELTSGLYTGLWSNVLKEAPNAAIYLGVYELIKSVLMGLQITSFFHDLPLVTFLVAGALGDAVGSIVRVPAELVNKRLQLGVNDNWVDALKDAFLSPTGRQASLMTWQAVLLRDVPYGGLQIMLYEFGKLLLSNHSQWLWGIFSQQGVFEDVMVGALAGALAAMATTPADVLVTKLSVQDTESVLEKGRFMGVRPTAMQILQEEGIFGFFRGTWQRGLYYAPMIGLFFALYEFNRGVISHPQAVVAMTAEPIKSVSAVLANEWHHLPGQVAAIYSATAPVLAGLVSLVSNHLPLAAGFANAASN